jgi:hypothetical protein
MMTNKTEDFYTKYDSSEKVMLGIIISDTCKNGHLAKNVNQWTVL